MGQNDSMDMMTPPEGFVIEFLEMRKPLSGGAILIRYDVRCHEWRWLLDKEGTDGIWTLIPGGRQPTLSEAVSVAHVAATKHGLLLPISLSVLRSTKTINSLIRFGVSDLRQLESRRRTDFADCRGVGRQALSEVDEALREHGLWWKPEP